MAGGLGRPLIDLPSADLSGVHAVNGAVIPRRRRARHSALTVPEAEAHARQPVQYGPAGPAHRAAVRPASWLINSEGHLNAARPYVAQQRRSTERERKQVRQASQSLYRRCQYLSLIHISEPTRPY